MNNSIFIVTLRQPKNSEDRRRDPYWEVGSFGCTGCHKKHLLNPKTTQVRNGASLAFAQGGPHGVRLLLVTPPVQVIQRPNELEVKWKAVMPLRYGESAPLLLDKHGNSDFSILQKFIHRQTPHAVGLQKFTSAFRSFSKPLSNAIAAQIVNQYARIRKARKSDIAKSFLEALPERQAWVSEMKQLYPQLRESRVEEYERRYSLKSHQYCGSKKTSTCKTRRSCCDCAH